MSSTGFISGRIQKLGFCQAFLLRVAQRRASEPLSARRAFGSVRFVLPPSAILPYLPAIPGVEHVREVAVSEIFRLDEKIHDSHVSDHDRVRFVLVRRGIQLEQQYIFVRFPRILLREIRVASQLVPEIY